MAIAENQVVSIEYELTEAGGSEILDSNKGHGPLEFITGKGQIIPGLERQLYGLEKGESADIKVPAAEAYGEYNPEAVDTLPKEQFAGLDLKEGMQLYGQSEDGQTVQVTVKSFDENGVTIDYNHPLAGMDLMFSVTILDTREATPDEILSGQVGGGDESCGTGCGCG
ncbi:MAG: peptidylprolyl isomerase [Campylobacteraceae bacterium 4484_4]|nr:MAG: peptidylprolyl isomerase [Campylobacteraceae bacterium 4484_4]